MELTEREKGMGLMIVTCLCCGETHKTHEANNTMTFSLIPNYGCEKCKGVDSYSVELTEREKGMGLMIVTCLCCGETYKTQEANNAMTFSLTPNYGCAKCKGVDSLSV
jgi:RNase P subunit RPR2